MKNPLIGNYIKVVKDHYAVFSGRAKRSEFWWFALADWIVTFFIGLVAAVVALPLGALYGVLTLCPRIALLCRRGHDIGLSGFKTLAVIFIPLLGAVLIFVLRALFKLFYIPLDGFAYPEAPGIIYSLFAFLDGGFGALLMIFCGLLIMAMPLVIALIPSQKKDNKWGVYIP